ncbi:MAG: tautomerase family protein [Desulfobacter sp.]
MPHIIVKLYNGRTEEQKQELATRIARDVVEVTGCKERSVSVAFEEFAPEDWTEKVYRPDICDGPGVLYKKPGYDPFATSQETGSNEERLMAYVREAAETAAREDTTGYFNPMSWLDLELEDNPRSFDPFFDTPWDELSDNDKGLRMAAVRKVL